jgi:hypothetical protein
MTQQQKTPPPQVKIMVPNEIKRGVYCNLLLVSHTKEEFLMDFVLISPSEAVVTSRVIMSPGHMKRTLSALKDNLEKYEKEIGKIEVAPSPTAKRTIGFIKS